MNNPYEYLGVSRNASEQEVMNAYRIIAASIHNSTSTEAEKANRLNELNQAYDYVLNEIRGTAAYQNISSNNYNNQNYGYNYQGYNQFSDVRQRINNGRLDEAETILDGIPTNMRTAEWNYLKGLIHQRRGWLNEAYRYYQAAYTMEPSNPEYAAAYNAMQSNANGGYNTSNNSSSSCDSCDICSGLICADCCCEFMGGDLISCC